MFKVQFSVWFKRYTVFSSMVDHSKYDFHEIYFECVYVQDLVRR